MIYSIIQIRLLIFIKFTAYQVQKSHYPRTFTGLKEGEAESLETAHTLMITITICLCLFSLLEAIFFHLYSSVVKYKYAITQFAYMYLFGVLIF